MYSPEPRSAQDLPPGFSIIHSNRLEKLRDLAIQWVKRHPINPLENEIFIVQSNGMAQWLKLGLAGDGGCGISAATDFQMPARFLWSAYRAILGQNQVPAESPFDKSQLIWRLLRLIPSLLQDDRFNPLKRYLIDDEDLRKRYQLACHLADLYDQYQVYRADWIEDWEADLDQLRDGLGKPAPLDHEQVWQPELWRKIREDVPVDLRETSRSILHRHFLHAADGLKQRPQNLPRRVIVFGVSSLPQQALEALNAIAKFSQVLMFVHNPCRFYWADIIEDRELLKIMRSRHNRKDSLPEEISLEDMHQHVNPLLAAWGKQGRDFIGLLYGYDRPDDYRSKFDAIDLFHDVVVPGAHDNLLQQVQQAVLDLKELPSSPGQRQLISPFDQSISFQLAHSRQREVEILHDQLLYFFQTIPGLKPRDIIVMTPDIDLYTPHIEAVFGNIESYEPRFIPFTIADRSQYTNLPMLFALEKLLHLPTSRITASDVIDLLEIPAFINKFGIDEKDLPKLQQWIEGAGIRWGLNSKQRTHFDIETPFEQNSWLFGLRRMLLGYAVGSGEPWQDIEPYDEVSGIDATIVGPLFIVLERLEKYCWLFSQPARAEEWHQHITDLVEECFEPANQQDQISQGRIVEVLDTWLDACVDAQLEEALPLPVVRDAILGPLKDSSISQRFLAGRVNFCTLMPMRAIPFKVVCLLGMNDGEYPRSKPPVDFDLMSGPGCYRPGDRSRREDDRYLFIEALLSAREKLYVSYIGRSVRDNGECMPSVLVSQLRDYLENGWQIDENEETKSKLIEQLSCLHPLQPFSKDYFQSQRSEKLFTFSQEWRAIFDSNDADDIGTALQPPQYEGALQISQLVKFLKIPVQQLFNQRLKVFYDEIAVTTENQEPFALDHLAPFNYGRKLLAAGLAVRPDKSKNTVIKEAKRLLNTGEIPINALGQLAIDKLIEPIYDMLLHYHELNQIWPHQSLSREIKFPFDLDGCACETIEDWLDQLRCTSPPQNDKDEDQANYARWEYYEGNILDKYGKLAKIYPMISPWVKHLAGCSQGMNLHSYLITPDRIAEFKPLPQEQSQIWLQQIIAHWWMGLSMPLPVTAKSALAYLQATFSTNAKKSAEELELQAQNAARRVYHGDGYNWNGELGSNIYLQRTYPDFDSLWQDQNNRFQQLAEDLYLPMMKSLTGFEDI